MLFINLSDFINKKFLGMPMYGSGEIVMVNIYFSEWVITGRYYPLQTIP